jgi:hypothetical protein
MMSAPTRAADATGSVRRSGSLRVERPLIAASGMPGRGERKPHSRIKRLRRKPEEIRRRATCRVMV